MKLSVQILIARSLYILKYRYIHGLIYAVVGVCLCMSCTHASTLSWHLQLSGISSWVWNDHHLREIVHQPNWSHTTGDKPYMQHSPLLLRSVEQENKQTKEQTTVISIVASFKPCVASEQGKSTTIAWGWPSIERQGNPRAQKKSETTLNPTLNGPLLP